MAIGVYFMTSIDENSTEYISPFSSKEEVITAYQAGALSPRQLVNVRFEGSGALVKTTAGRILFNELMPEGWDFLNEPIPSKIIGAIFERSAKELPVERVALMIDAIKNFGFAAMTTSGLSFAVSDNEVYKDKEVIISAGNKKAKEIEDNYRLGLITNEERRKLTIDMWMTTTDELAEKTWSTFSIDNPIRTIIDTGGGRINKNTIKQLSAMRGIGVDPLGNFVELPTKSNYREGLTIFEYVTAIRGSRKGLTDTALRTADAGYLTRRLVDVSHDCIVRSLDCGNTEGLEIFSEGLRANQFAGRP